MRKRALIFCVRETVCTTAAWKRFLWTAFPSMKKEKMPSGSPSNTRLINEFTPVQENSNEDELAGPTAWLPDPCRRGAGEQPTACADAGARCGDLGGHLQRCHYASAGTVGGSRGRRRTSGRSRRPNAEPRSPGAGFRGGSTGGAEDSYPRDICSCARGAQWAIAARSCPRGCGPDC